MTTIWIERHLDSDTLRLPELEPLVGKDVEILVIEKAPGKKAAAKADSYPLRGSVLRYDEPFEPVAEDDWEALQ